MPAVLVATPEQWNLLTIAKAMAALEKIPLQDALFKVRSGSGILADGLAADAAQAMVSNLEKLGVQTVTVDTLAIVPVPDIVQTITYETDGVVFTHANQKVVIPNGGVRIIAAAGFRVTTETKTTEKIGPSATQKVLSAGLFMATGMPIKIGPKAKVVEKTKQETERLFFLDVVAGSPARRWRIDAQRFDYSGLGARKALFGFGNFKIMLQDLIQASPRAVKNPGTQIIAANRALTELSYETLADLDKDVRWLYNLPRD